MGLVEYIAALPEFQHLVAESVNANDVKILVDGRMTPIGVWAESTEGRIVDIERWESDVVKRLNEIDQEITDLFSLTQATDSSGVTDFVSDHILITTNDGRTVFLDEFTSDLSRNIGSITSLVQQNTSSISTLSSQTWVNASGFSGAVNDVIAQIITDGGPISVFAAGKNQILSDWIDVLYTGSNPITINGEQKTLKDWIIAAFDDTVLSKTDIENMNFINADTGISVGGRYGTLTGLLSDIYNGDIDVTVAGNTDLIGNWIANLQSAVSSKVSLDETITSSDGSTSKTLWQWITDAYDDTVLTSDQISSMGFLSLDSKLDYNGYDIALSDVINDVINFFDNSVTMVSSYVESGVTTPWDNIPTITIDGVERTFPDALIYVNSVATNGIISNANSISAIDEEINAQTTGIYDRVVSLESFADNINSIINDVIMSSSAVADSMDAYMSTDSFKTAINNMISVGTVQDLMLQGGEFTALQQEVNFNTNSISDISTNFSTKVGDVITDMYKDIGSAIAMTPGIFDNVIVSDPERTLSDFIADYGSNLIDINNFLFDTEHGSHTVKEMLNKMFDESKIHFITGDIHVTLNNLKWCGDGFATSCSSNDRILPGDFPDFYRTWSLMNNQPMTITLFGPLLTSGCYYTSLNGKDVCKYLQTQADVIDAIQGGKHVLSGLTIGSTDSNFDLVIDSSSNGDIPIYGQISGGNDDGWNMDMKISEFLPSGIEPRDIVSGSSLLQYNNSPYFINFFSGKTVTMALKDAGILVIDTAGHECFDYAKMQTEMGITDNDTADTFAKKVYKYVLGLAIQPVPYSDDDIYSNILATGTDLYGEVYTCEYTDVQNVNDMISEIRKANDQYISNTLHIGDYDGDKLTFSGLDIFNYITSPNIISNMFSNMQRSMTNSTSISSIKTTIAALQSDVENAIDPDELKAALDDFKKNSVLPLITDISGRLNAYKNEVDTQFGEIMDGFTYDVNVKESMYQKLLGLIDSATGGITFDSLIDGLDIYHDYLKGWIDDNVSLANCINGVNIGDDSVGVIEKVRNVVVNLPQHIDNFMISASRYKYKLQDIIGYFIDELSGISGYADSIKNAISGIQNGITDMFSGETCDDGTSCTISTYLKKKLLPIEGKFDSFAKNHIKPLKDELNSLGSTIGELKDNARKSVLNVISDIVGRLEGEQVSFTNGLGQTWTGYIFADWLEGKGKLYCYNSSAIRFVLNIVLNDIKDGFADVISGVGATIESVYQNIENNLTSLKVKIDDIYSNFSGIGTAIYSDVHNAINDTINSIANTVQSLADGIDINPHIDIGSANLESVTGCNNG